MKTNYDLNTAIHNKFEIKIVDPKTNKVKQEAVGYNTICVGLWNELLNFRPYAKYIIFGSGTTAPTVNDTTLTSKIGSKAIPNDDTNKPTIINNEGTAYMVYEVALSEGEYVNTDISEVGIGYTNTAIATHALLQDMQGNPVTIHKGAADAAYIYATIYLHWDPAGYNNGTIKMFPGAGYTMGGTVHYALIERLLGKQYNSEHWPNYIVVGTVPGCGTFISSDASGKEITKSASLSSKSITFTSARFLSTEFNGNPICAMAFQYQNGDIMSPDFCCDAVIERGGCGTYHIQNENVGTGNSLQTQYNTKFAFPKNAHVYLNGVETHDVTVKELPPNDFTERYLRPLAANPLPSNMIEIVNINGHLIDYKGTFAFTAGSSTTAGVGYNNGVLIGGADKFLWNKHKLPLVSSGSWESTDYGGTYLLTMWGSNNLTAWDEIVHEISSGVINYSRVYEFYKISIKDLYGQPIPEVRDYKLFNNIRCGSNIVFTNPPPMGSVITISYDTDVVPKDESKAFNVSLTIHLAEGDRS